MAHYRNVQLRARTPPVCLTPNSLLGSNFDALFLVAIFQNHLVYFENPFRNTIGMFGLRPFVEIILSDGIFHLPGLVQ